MPTLAALQPALAALPTFSLTDVGHAIQLSLTPVFLLTGIAGLLNVMMGRLARIIDRGRQLTERGLVTPVADELRHEVASLEHRRHLASRAITACTLSALATCAVITLLFLEVMLSLHLMWLAGLLFTVSTLALLVGLSIFLREVHLATSAVRIPRLPDAG